MPRQGVKGIWETTTTATPSMGPAANLQLSATAREEIRLAQFDAWLDSFSRTTVDWNVEEEAQVTQPAAARAVAPALDGLGQVMQADRVVFYSAESPAVNRESTTIDLRFSSLASWSRTDEGPDKVASLDLDRSSPLGTALWSGRAHRVDRLTHPKALTSETSIDSVRPLRWTPARALLYVPAIANGELLGVFGIEAGVGAARWSGGMLRRAEFAARLIASVLDRIRLTEERNQQRSRAAQADRLALLGRVAGGVAHDFNNVLTAILGYTDLLEMEIADQLGAGSDIGGLELGEIRDATNRATALIHQILSFARAEETTSKSVDIKATVQSLEEMLRRVLGSNVTLTLEPGAGQAAGGRVLPASGDRLPLRVRLDTEKFERVLLNLAANARDALGEKVGARTFSLSTRCVFIDANGLDTAASAQGLGQVTGLCAGNYVRLTARDNGRGIEPKIAHRIFEPFFTTKQDLGTGLGLASAADFMREGGGEIRVESVLGEGTAFHLYFPTAAPAGLPALDAGGTGTGAETDAEEAAAVWARIPSTLDPSPALP